MLQWCCKWCIVLISYLHYYYGQRRWKLDTEVCCNKDRQSTRHYTQYFTVFANNTGTADLYIQGNQQNTAPIKNNTNLSKPFRTPFVEQKKKMLNLITVFIDGLEHYFHYRLFIANLGKYCIWVQEHSCLLPMKPQSKVVQISSKQRNTEVVQVAWRFLEASTDLLIQNLNIWPFH